MMMMIMIHIDTYPSSDNFFAILWNVSNRNVFSTSAIEDAMQSPFASSRVFIDLQSTGVPSERESISSSEICCFNSKL